MKPSRHPILLALCGLILLTGSLSAQNRPPIAVEITAPVGKASLAGFPFVIRLKIDNEMPVFNGTASITSIGVNPRLLLSMPIAVGPGTFTYELTPTIPADGISGVVIDLSHANGALIYRTERLLSRAPTNVPRILLAATPKTAKAITKALRLPLVRVPPRADEQIERVRPFVATLDAIENFPTNWTSLGIFGTLIWDGMGGDMLSPRQIEALSSWVYMGGHLIIAPEPGALEIPMASNNLFPATLNLETIPTKGMNILHGYGETTIYPSGMGHDSIVSIITTMLQPAPTGLSNLEEVENAVAFSTVASSIDAELRQALAKSVGYVDHTFYPLLALGLFYIFIVAVIDPMILRSLKIPWATWITMPVVTAIFSVIAIVVFKSTNIAPVGHAYIQIIDALPDQTAREISIDCIRTPAHQHPSLPLHHDELAIATNVGRSTQTVDLSTRPNESPHISYAYADRGTDCNLAGWIRLQLRPSQTTTRPPPPKFSAHSLRASGDYLTGKVTGPAGLRPTFAFLYWDGWFYELDSNLRVVRRSMQATDRALIQRLTQKLPKSIETAGPLGLARLAEQTARISVSLAAGKTENEPQQFGRRTLSGLAPRIPAGYGMICVVVDQSQINDGAQANTQAVICYRQLFTLSEK